MKMVSYKNLSQKSNVINYAYGTDYIIVEFRNGKERFYRYDYAATGKDVVENLKKLADAGEGLNRAVHFSKHIQYSRKSVDLEGAL